MTRSQDMPSGVVFLSFGSLGEVNKSCTQLMNLSAVYAQFGLIDYVPVMGVTHELLHLGTESQFIVFS